MSVPKKSQSLTGRSGFRGICPECMLNRDTRIAFAVRAWNKSAGEMNAWRDRMALMLSPLEQHGSLKDISILFVIPHHRDPEFELYGRAAGMTILSRPVTPLTFVQPEGTVEAEWTAGLNLPIAYMANVVPRNMRGETQIVFMSFDTDMDAGNAQTMSGCLRSQTGFIARRSMPRNVVDIPLFASAGKIIEHVADCIKSGDIPTEETFCQLASCNRNTLAAWPLSTFGHIGMFDPSCGRLGGMEDIFLLLRLMLDETINFSLPKTEIDYGDIRIETLRNRRSDDKDVVAQRNKLEIEVKTLKVIVSWLTLEYGIAKKKANHGQLHMNLSPHWGEFGMESKLFPRL